MMDVSEGRIADVVNTKKMYKGKDIYRLRIENAIGKFYEGPVSSILGNLEVADSSMVLSITELLCLRKYLLLQLVRTKEEKESYSDIPEVWENMINKCVSRESLQSMINTSDLYLSKLSQFFLYAPILFVRSKGEFIMPDGALMCDHISCPPYINPEILEDENGKPRIENGVFPDCPGGMLVNYFFYPMGPEHGILLLNPLWVWSEYISDIGQRTWAVDSFKIVDHLERSIPCDSSGREYICSIVQLDEDETIKLVKESFNACARTFVARDLKKLPTSLKEFIVENPNYQYKGQVKTLIKLFESY